MTAGNESIKSIRKAVFPVAGLGTRFLPATKASPKEMMAVVDKPLIQYALEEAVVASITEKISVTGGISLRVVQPEELLKAADDPELEMSHDFVRCALARGDMAFGAFEGDRLVGYTWRTFTAAAYADGLWVRVERPYQYSYKGFTRAAYRGRHIHVGITLLADIHLMERGYTGEIGLINLTNFTSIGVAKYKGRRTIAHAGYVKWFGRRILFSTPGAKKIGAEVSEPRDIPRRDDVGQKQYRSGPV
jgi:hypothetical protein